MSNLIRIEKGRAIVSLNLVGWRTIGKRGSSGSFNVPVKKRGGGGELTSALQTNFSRRWIIVQPGFTLSFPSPTSKEVEKVLLLTRITRGWLRSSSFHCRVSFALEPFWLNFWPINLHQDIFQELPTPVYLKIGEVFFFTPLSLLSAKGTPPEFVFPLSTLRLNSSLPLNTECGRAPDNFVSPFFISSSFIVRETSMQDNTQIALLVIYRSDFSTFMFLSIFCIVIDGEKFMLGFILNKVF